MYPWNGLTQTSDRRRRVLLDTNVWRYVVDAKKSDRLVRLAGDGPNAVQIAPAVLYETLRMQDSALRASLLTLMTNRSFLRLMPEAYSESIELLAAVEKKRPGWLRKDPNITDFERLQSDWSKKANGFWSRVRNLPQQEGQKLDILGDRVVLDAARAQAENARREMREARVNEIFPLNGWKGTLKAHAAGWKGDPIECWRIDGHTALSLALNDRQNPYRQWIEPFVNLHPASRVFSDAQWLKFWFYDTDMSDLPRQWMRWASAFIQRFRKVTPGTPADSQLSTYFFETDMFVSADKALLDLLNDCHPYAPKPLPKGFLIEGGTAGVPTLMKLLAEPLAKGP